MSIRIWRICLPSPPLHTRHTDRIGIVRPFPQNVVNVIGSCHADVAQTRCISCKLSSRCPCDKANPALWVLGKFATAPDYSRHPKTEKANATSTSSSVNRYVRRRSSKNIERSGKKEDGPAQTLWGIDNAVASVLRRDRHERLRDPSKWTAKR